MISNFFYFLNEFVTQILMFGYIILFFILKNIVWSDIGYKLFLYLGFFNDLTNLYHYIWNAYKVSCNMVQIITLFVFLFSPHRAISSPHSVTCVLPKTFHLYSFIWSQFLHVFSRKQNLPQVSMAECVCSPSPLQQQSIWLSVCMEWFHRQKSLFGRWTW